MQGAAVSPQGGGVYAREKRQDPSDTKRFSAVFYCTNRGKPG